MGSIQRDRSGLVRWPGHLHKLVRRQRQVPIRVKTIKESLYLSLQFCIELKTEALHAGLDRQCDALDEQAELVDRDRSVLIRVKEAEQDLYI